MNSTLVPAQIAPPGLADIDTVGVLLALMVTPMSNTIYLIYRIGVPLMIGFFITLITYPMAGLVPIEPLDLVIVSLLGAFTAPLTASAM